MALEWLSKINDFLEQVPANVNNWFTGLFKSGEELTQDFVDKCCAYAAWKVNVMVERKRQAVIKTLNEEYGGYLKALTVVTVVKQAVTDPLGTIGSFFGMLAGPYAKVVDFLQALLKEIPRLAANLANIANSLPPTPPNPHINFNAFKLKINSISMGDITAGSSLPTPEQMFPEPEKPFGKKAFNDSFENAPVSSEINKVIYTEGESSVLNATSIIDAIQTNSISIMDTNFD